MDRDEALRLLLGGPEGIRQWNRRRIAGEEIPALRRANLISADLKGAHLIGARLEGAHFQGAHLIGVDFSGAHLMGADLQGADLRDANLRYADLRYTDLGSADLEGAYLEGAHLIGTDLQGTHLGWVRCRNTIFVDLDLTGVEDLDSVIHVGPSHVSTSTLIRSGRHMPESFLRGCGLRPWEVLSARLYDYSLTPAKLADLQKRIFDAWTEGRSMISGCFFSYSWEDKKFVDKLGARLERAGIKAWIDRADMLAGPLQPQVWRAIQEHEAVILVLSEHSVRSDWVENELDMARSKEKAAGRAVLCPVALDDAWKAKVEAQGGPGDPNRKLWLPLLQKNVVGFPRRRTRAFEAAFEKLLGGLNRHYGPGGLPAVP